MRKILLVIVVAALGANGLAMVGWPSGWYHALPTVAHTGPFNPHFVRDIGCAYLACAGALVAFARDPERGRSAALTAAGFLILHALVHVWDALAGRSELEHLAQDALGVFAIPAIVLWLAWPRDTHA